MKAETTKTDSTGANPAASFSSLVWGLSASGLIHLGRKLHPEMEEHPPNLSLAKQTIDTLEMLKAKTDGNLSSEETELLDEVLYQLRMSYVKVEEDMKKPGETGDKPDGEPEKKAEEAPGDATPGDEPEEKEKPAE
jgi:hypothetical protein